MIIMDIQSFLDNVRDLTDLELAILLSLIAQQHCLISTDDDFIDDLSSELALIASEIFDLTYAVVSLDDSTSVEKFGEAILDQNRNHDFGATDASPHDHLQPPSRLASIDIRAGSIAPSQTSRYDLDSRTVANVIIAKNFNYASLDVQIAALELITRRRIYSRTTVHQVPKVFLFIPLVSSSTQNVRLNEHLNDRISISHCHNLDDGFANLEELDPHFNNHNVSKNGRSEPNGDKASIYSYNSSQDSTHNYRHSSRQIPQTVVDKLRDLGKSASITPEIRRYLQDVVVFLRMAHGVDGGVTPSATIQFVNLARYLAPLHGIDFVTPSLVALAARKIYPHRLLVAKPERDRSMQWGSDIKALGDLLHDLTAEAIIEGVLATIPSPV